jgi:hypothetical protein
MSTALLIYRAVAGAVRNVSHAHPRWPMHPSMAGSIAKRATGTLLALMPSVLAAGPVTQPSNHAGVWGQALAPAARRRLASRRRLVLTQLGRMAGEARHAGQTERLAVLVEVLRILAPRRRLR